jgi:integrase
MGLLVRNPTDAIEAPRWRPQEMKTLDVAGVADLLRAASGTELRLPIAVLVGTGMRRGELFGLRWADVDFEAGRLTIKRSVEMIDGERREKAPKTTRSPRTLALAPFVVAALRQQKSEQAERRLVLGMGRDENACVFDRPDGQPWNPDSFSWSFAELVRRSGVSRVRLHDLRHSHATIALGVGADLKMISAALGHSTIAVTANTYLHVTESMQRSHADRIGAALGEAVSGSIGPIVGSSVPQPCHKPVKITKKPRGYKVFMVAPTGFEPVLPP